MGANSESPSGRFTGAGAWNKEWFLILRDRINGSWQNPKQSRPWGAPTALAGPVATKNLEVR